VADDSEIDNSHHFIFGSNRSLRVKILLHIVGSWSSNRIRVLKLKIFGSELKYYGTRAASVNLATSDPMAPGGKKHVLCPMETNAPYLRKAIC